MAALSLFTLIVRVFGVAALSLFTLIVRVFGVFEVAVPMRN